MHDHKIKISSLLNFKILFSLFILLIIFLLLEGVYYFYYNNIMEVLGILPYQAKSGFNQIIWKESGLVEYLQVFFLLVTIFFISLFIKKEYFKLKSLEKLLIFFYFLGVNYYFLEEISYGQHIFGWQSSGFFLEINSQDETNIHNISSIFNELPRNLLFVWCALTFLWIGRISFKNNFLQKFVFPDIKLKYISYLILFFFIPDFLIDKLALAPETLAIDNKDIFLNTFFHLISFNFIRLSELEELLFNFYILNHSFYLVKSKL
tara:strand:- start:291 stop:1079 length:789 start_codon:yes stop_codon:yes gene_type:complete